MWRCGVGLATLGFGLVGLATPLSGAQLIITGDFSMPTVPAQYLGYVQPGDAYDFTMVIDDTATDTSAGEFDTAFGANSFTLISRPTNTGTFNPSSSTWLYGGITIQEEVVGAEILRLYMFSGDLPPLGAESPIYVLFEMSWANGNYFTNGLPVTGATLGEALPVFPDFPASNPDTNYALFGFLGVYEVYGKLNSIQAIPEPGTMALLLGAIGGSVLCTRRRRTGGNALSAP